MKLLAAVLSVSPILCAQTTWIVDAGGGPGAQFADLPSAVAAAADGDTIVVREGPFGEGATPFVTDKGLTIVGEGGFVPIGGNGSNRYRIENLPAGSVFRMVGFSRPTDGALWFDVQNCQGAVHFESLRCRENIFFITLPSFDIVDCQSVTMREVETFGAPAVRIANSTVSLVRCRLGLTYIGLGGGPAIGAADSDVRVVQPRFDTGFGEPAAITLDASSLTIGGDGASYIRNDPRFSTGGHLIDVQNGGVVQFDPDVGYAWQAGSSFVNGAAVLIGARQPCSWTSGAVVAGQPVTIQSLVPPAAFVFQAIGAPLALTPTPSGTLGVDPLQSFAFFPGAATPPTGAWSGSVTMPLSMPLGAVFATQAVYLTTTGVPQLGLGEPAILMVR